MDQTLAALRSFSVTPEVAQNAKIYDSTIRSYIAVLAKLSGDAKTAILSKPAKYINALDPSLNSIGYLAVLDILMNAANSSAPAFDRTLLLDWLLDFFLKFEPRQIRYVGASMLAVLDQIALCKLYPPTIVVELLATAILRIDPSSSTFTSTHLSLAKLAYDTNNISPVLAVLDRDILSFPNTPGPRETRPPCDPELSPTGYISGLTDQIKSSAVLEYNLLRGLIYISRRNWSKAQSALEQVITHPTKDKGVSKIMSEAHKKWVLVGLINTGKSPTLPPYTATAAKTSYSITNRPYNVLARMFDEAQSSKLQTEVEECRSIWEEDGNLSLVAEVIGSYQKWQIMNLRKIYIQVSISQIRAMTLNGQTGEALGTDQDVINLVKAMIDSGMLKGSLQTGGNADDSYLAFHEDDSSLAEAGFAQEIARSHQSIEFLTKQYQVMNERLGNSKEYVRHLVREQRRVEKDSTDAGLGFDSQIEDEDLMTGVMAHV